MAQSGIPISVERRRAEVTLGPYWKKQLGIDVDKRNCFVSGPFQSTDGDFATPVFVCELDDGRVFPSVVESVRFLDTVGETE